MINKDIKRINVLEATSILKSGTVTIVDIRDRQSFEIDHIQDAQHVTDANTQTFMDKANKEQPLLVYCYHGNSSQIAAKYFSKNGFNQVYSLDGGFDIWKSKHN